MKKSICLIFVLCALILACYPAQAWVAEKSYSTAADLPASVQEALPTEWAYVSGMGNANTIYVLLAEGDDIRRIWIFSGEDDHYSLECESAPLPRWRNAIADLGSTTDDSLYLFYEDASVTFTFQRMHDSAWVLRYVQGIREVSLGWAYLIPNRLTTERLLLYASPSADAEIIGELYNMSMRVQVLDDQGEWVKISTDDATGYIKREFLNYGEQGFGYDAIGYYDQEEPSGFRRSLCGTNTVFDLSTLDVVQLPVTLNEAVSLIDTNGWALVKSDERTDRLHLRTGPSTDAASIGRYYSGTPVQVLEDLGEWAKVSVGGIQGYMMKEFLAFGQDMLNVKHWFLYEALIEEAAKQGVNVYASPETRSAIVGVLGEYHLEWDWNLHIIATVGDSWYHVLSEDGICGYVEARYFCDPNS